MITWSTVRHFAEAEFCCACGACPESTHPPMDQDLVDRLDDIRHVLGTRIRVTSGYRCPAHNAAIGGDPNSAHLTGQAVDIAWEGPGTIGGRRRMLLGLALSVPSGIDRLEIAPRHLHLEHRPERPAAVWVGTSR